MYAKSKSVMHTLCIQAKIVALVRMRMRKKKKGVKKHEEGGKHVLKRRQTFRLELERETRRPTAGSIEADAPI
jgi:hypothetical protein